MSGDFEADAHQAGVAHVRTTRLLLALLEGRVPVAHYSPEPVPGNRWDQFRVLCDYGAAMVRRVGI